MKLFVLGQISLCVAAATIMNRNKIDLLSVTILQLIHRLISFEYIDVQTKLV